MAVISSDVVLAGRPYRQNICRRGVAVMDTTETGVITSEQFITGSAIIEETVTGRLIESTRVPGIWRLCRRPIDD